MTKKKRKRPIPIDITIVRGVEGLSVYVNDFRVAGSKPWGGGAVVKEWKISKNTIRAALCKSNESRQKFLNKALDEGLL